MPKLTKRDIVVSISNQTGMVQHQVFDVVQRTLDKITDSLANNIPVELRNFGVFQPRLTKPRVGRNPNQPGSSFVIPPRATVKFKAGKIMLGYDLRSAHESKFWIVFSRRSKLIGFVRCSEKPASLAWFMSCSLPKPLSAIPGKSLLSRTSRINS